VASVSRLDHYWSAEQLEQPGRLPRAARDRSGGHRDAGLGQQPLGEHLVGGDVHPDGRGQVGQRRAHQPPVPAVAEPEHAAAADPTDRDAAPAGGAGYRGRTHAEALAFHHPAHPGQAGRQRRHPPRQQVADGGDGGLQQLSRYDGVGRLIGRALQHDVIPAVSAGPERPAQVHIAAGPGGQLERHVLGDMTEVGTAGHRREESARPPGRAVMVSQAGQRRGQPVSEARVVGRLPAGQGAELEPRDADRAGGVHVRAVQVAQVFQPHVRSLGACR
jgi:hypothetical protein